MFCLYFSDLRLAGHNKLQLGILKHNKCVNKLPTLLWKIEYEMLECRFVADIYCQEYYE